MKPIDQTTFGHPGGNCFSACVASIMELSLEQVPYFMAAPEDRWYARFEAWLERRGLYPLMLPIPDGPRGWAPSGYHILSGNSPRKPEDPEALHSVVGYHGRILHDPHPSRAGLLSWIDTIVLVPMDPSKHRTVQP